MFTKVFALDVVERALKTFAQSLLAVFVAGSGALTHVSFPAALATAGMAALVSVLSSVAGGGDSSASLVPAVRTSGKHETA